MRAVSQGACECDAQAQAQRRNRVRRVTLRALDGPEGRNPRELQALGVGRSFFTTGIAATGFQTLRHQEYVVDPEHSITF